MTLRYLLQKEFIQIRRNPFLPRLIILFPILIMCVMPWVMNLEVKHIAMDVVDNDRSTGSQQLVQSIAVSKYFSFHGQPSTYREALRDIERSQADIVLVIPHGYSRDLTLGKKPQILIAANAVNGTKGAIGSVYLTRLVTASAFPLASIRSEVSTLFLHNQHFDFKLFMIPALLAIVMMMMTGYLPTLNIVGEKEAGTIEQINVTPVKKSTFILAKLLPYWLIALFIITACLALSWLIYGITPAGSVTLVYLLAMLLAVFFSSLGLIISNYSDTMQQAVFVMWFFVMILMLLSGLFTPIRSMPTVAYLTTYINPVSYFIEAMRTVFVRGGNFSSIAHQVLALSLIGLFMSGWAVLSYKKNH